MTEFVQFQIEMSTAEEERTLFSSEQSEIAGKSDSNSIMPAGTYRLVNGEIYRIVAGPAPILSDK